MTTIKRTLCAVLAAAMLVLLFGCANDASVPAPTAGADATAPAETANTEADFTLKLGFDAELPPYGYLDENGEYAGFDIDMAKELCSRLGWGLDASSSAFSSPSSAFSALLSFCTATVLPARPALSVMPLSLFTINTCELSIYASDHV